MHHLTRFALVSMFGAVVAPTAHADDVPLARSALCAWNDGWSTQARGGFDLDRAAIEALAPGYEPATAVGVVLTSSSVYDPPVSRTVWRRTEMSFADTIVDANGATIDRFRVYDSHHDVKFEETRDLALGAAFGIEVDGETIWLQEPGHNTPVVSCGDDEAQIIDLWTDGTGLGARPGSGTVAHESARFGICVQRDTCGPDDALVGFDLRRDDGVRGLPGYDPTGVAPFVITSSHHGDDVLWLRRPIAYQDTIEENGVTFDRFRGRFDDDTLHEDVLGPYARDPIFGAAFGLDLDGHTLSLQEPGKNAPVIECAQPLYFIPEGSGCG